MIKILVDTLGGDKSPTVNIEGAIKAINEIDDIEIIFVGDEAKINDELSKLEYDKKRVSIVHAPDEITCNDKQIVLYTNHLNYLKMTNQLML